MKSFLEALDERTVRAFLFSGVRAARFGAETADVSYRKYCARLQKACWKKMYQTGLNQIIDTFAKKIGKHPGRLRECVVAILTKDSSLTCHYTQRNGNVTKVTPWSLSEKILERVLKQTSPNLLENSLRDIGKIYYESENLPLLSELLKGYRSEIN